MLKSLVTDEKDFRQVVNKTICFLSYKKLTSKILKNKCNQQKKTGNI